MADRIRILLVGESWVSTSTHIKGWDFFSSSVYEEGHQYLRAALTGTDFDFHHIPGHLAAEQFPRTLEELAAYDVVIISDIGANTLLLHPDVWLHGKAAPNRLRLLAEWTERGGGLIMCGGYLSFSGIYGSARYGGSPIEPVLPVTMYRYDDRIEAPHGARVAVADPQHPAVAGTTGEWPVLLGYNEVELAPGATLVATIDDDPFIATKEVGKGRSLVWTSDIGPHWCPKPFLEWEGYNRVWQQSVRWVAGR